MIYDLIAPFYDSVNSHIDYKSWADFIEKIFEKDVFFLTIFLLFYEFKL